MKRLILLFFFWGIFGGLYCQIKAQVPKVVVPSVIGEDVVTANQSLIAIGLWNNTTFTITDNRPQGIVIRQVPEAGSVVDLSTSVSLYVSSGPSPVIVPSVIGKTTQEAKEMLLASQLIPGNIIEQPSDGESGRIIFQDPQAGTSVVQGTSVNLTVSVKIDDGEISVPNVIKMSFEQAREVIEKTGLVMDKIVEESSNVPEGTIIGQYPPAGEKIKIGSPVTLTMAKPIPIPITSHIPRWIYWAGGIVASVFLGGYLGRKSGKRKQNQKRDLEKEPELKFKIIQDKGIQTIHVQESVLSEAGLRLKIIPDKGVQTLKTS